MESGGLGQPEKRQTRTPAASAVPALWDHTPLSHFLPGIL